jgi:hypothetical protein
VVIDYVPVCNGKKGLYRWKIAGRSLTITKVQDGCGFAVGLFAGVWHRSEPVLLVRPPAAPLSHTERRFEASLR